MKYHQVLPAAFLPAVVLVFLAGCVGLPTPQERFTMARADGATAAATDVVLSMPRTNPAEPGPYRVARFRYGSAHNPRRPEYAHAAVPTEAFDLSPFFDDMNRAFWGYDASETPVNGVVWYPVGDGPFPVFLIVHGNHNPASFSEPGYDYLGEILASRGIVTVSVDQNMLNGNHRGENGARAVLLLEHARTVLAMHENPGTPLAGRLDTERVVLAGHSRGGEAAALAAILNTHERYPGDGTVELDYRLPIRGVISIAPVEGQYRPAGRELPVPDGVHFLVLHGSQDGDVNMHMGLRFFHRPGAQTAHRQSVWIYGADHSAFNSRWAVNRDPVPSSPRLLLPVSAQQEAARVFISAFLEYAFDRDPDAARIAESPYRFSDWLPPTEYRTQYRRPGVAYLNTFEDDDRFRSAALPGWHNSISDAASWREIRFGLTSDADSVFSIFGHAGTWGLEIAWEAEEEGSSFVVFRSESGDQPFAADAVAIDIVLAAWDTEAAFRPWLSVETVHGTRHGIGLESIQAIHEAPEVRILTNRNRHYVPQTIYVPLDLIPGLEPGSELRAVELSIPRDADGRMIIPAVMLYGGGA